MSPTRTRKVISLILAVTLLWQQSGFAQALPDFDLSGHLRGVINSVIFESYRPLHLRSLSFDPAENKFNLLIDKGTQNTLQADELKAAARELMNYFLVGVTLPADTFWVNLRPDSPEHIIDADLAQTDVGRILLESDLQLKKDTARLLSPESMEGKEYWRQVYRKADELFGADLVDIPTMSRPWIVPGEIIIGETGEGAYIYKASLKVMLEQDHLKGVSPYAFTDERMRELNEYAAGLMRTIVIPRLTKEVNVSARYAKLRQVYYSLILAQWFKARAQDTQAPYAQMIDSSDVSGLQSRESWSPQTYFEEYRRLFYEGEYRCRDTIATASGETTRVYVSGGMQLGVDIPEFGKASGAGSPVHIQPLPSMPAPPDYTIGVGISPTEITIADKPRERASSPVPGRGTTASQGHTRDAAWQELLPDTLRAQAVSLNEYIAYRKIYLAEKSGTDIMDVLDDPAQFKQRVERAAGGLTPKNIDNLITRQAESIEQSILELVSNASDATTGRRSPIGRFGMGALQMLAFVLEGGIIRVDTATESGHGRRIIFFRDENNRISFISQAIVKETRGTSVRIKIPEHMRALQNSIIEHLKSRLNLSDRMPVYLNGRLLNPLDDYIFLDGTNVHYLYPREKISVMVNDGVIEVSDSGSGMSDDVIFNKYLLPRIGENQPVPREQTREEINADVHIFYKAPEFNDGADISEITFQVSGINIQTAEIRGFNLPRKMVIQLPASTRLPVSRNAVQVDITIHRAIKALAEKITARDPIHHIQLVNGLMAAVRFLDERNQQVDVQKSLIDTAREAFIPFVMRQETLLLPNEAEFREIAVPEGTVYMDSDLVYAISPAQIPGAYDLADCFRPGTFRKAFAVPFRNNSSLTYVAMGPYLLLNKAVYEKYKRHPMLLNLRLNFYIGYGKPRPAKGWIVPFEEKQTKPREVPLSSALERYPLINESLPSTSKNSLLSALADYGDDAGKADVLLDNLQEFIRRIPEPMRLTVNWNRILTWKNLVLRNETPSTEFLNIHAAYFANSDHPGRLTRYLTNILNSSVVSQFSGHPQFHLVLSQINPRGVEYLNQEILDAVEETLGDANLENYERCFEAINNGLEHITDASGAQRLILRWLRIYKRDPQAALNFTQLLDREYKRDIPEDRLMNETPAAKPVAALDAGKLTHLQRDILEFGYQPQRLEPSGLIYENKPVYISRDAHAGYWTFSHQVGDGVMKELARFKEEGPYDRLYLVLSPQTFNGLPVFMNTADHQGRVRLITVDLRQNKTQVIMEYQFPQWHRAHEMVYVGRRQGNDFYIVISSYNRVPTINLIETNALTGGNSVVVRDQIASDIWSLFPRLRQICTKKKALILRQGVCRIFFSLWF